MDFLLIIFIHYQPINVSLLGSGHHTRTHGEDLTNQNWFLVHLKHCILLCYDLLLSQYTNLGRLLDASVSFFRRRNLLIYWPICQ